MAALSGSDDDLDWEAGEAAGGDDGAGDDGELSDAYEDAKRGYDDDEYSGDASDGVSEEEGAPLTPPPAPPSSEWITNSRGRGRARGRTSRETSSQLAEGTWNEEQKLRISVRRLSACGPELADRTSCRSAVL